jgi:dTDP-4-amino-4,6-dideoxygalactose transaminase
MNVPLLDLKRQYASIKTEIDAALAQVIESQMFILGPKVKECETAIAAYSACKHGVGVSSGTDAILIALMAEQIGPGDEVITTPYTFFATGGCVARLGAVPIFVDIDPKSYNIRPDLIEKAITPRTKVLMPVHLFGQTADMDPIMEIARRHKLVVIEDAAQAIGAEYKGRRAGSIGDYGCFSFFPSKNLGGFGDGGMVTTNDPAKAERLSILRAHGSRPKYYHKIVGGNFRLDALQAAIIDVKLRHLDNWTGGRQANAARYGRMFKESGLIEKDRITIPTAIESRHIYNQYVIRVHDRNGLQGYLKEQGIGTEVYYPVPLHLQECFASLGHAKGAFPESEKAALETLALPIFPELRAEEMQCVVETIAKFYNS